MAEREQKRKAAPQRQEDVEEVAPPSTEKGEKIKALRIYLPTGVLLEQIGGAASPEQSVEPSHSKAGS